MKNKLITLIILIFLGFIIIGCSNKEISKENVKKDTQNNKEIYIKYVQELNKINETTENLPFEINVDYIKENDSEIRFEVSIDNPIGTINNIKALAIHNKQTDDVFPSVGIFDSPITLIKGEKPEGIVLVGYIPYTKDIDDFKKEIILKVLIKYVYENNEYSAYYVTKK